MCLITLGSVVACQAVGFPVYIGSCSIFYFENSLFVCLFPCRYMSLFRVLCSRHSHWTSGHVRSTNGHSGLHTASVWNGL